MQFPNNLTLHERYLLRSVLGVGGQAYVFRALDQQLMVERAIKVLSPKSFSIAEARTRFQSEAQILAGIEHPNIVRVYDIVHAQNYLFIVMELLGRATMSDVVRQLGSLPESSVRSVLLPIVNAVQAAHEDGIIHRDLKPSNILLSVDGKAKLSDFGIAQLQRQEDLGLTKTGIVMGTQGYMSPEQRTSAKNVDARADVYSLGATLFRLATGERPVDLFAKEEADPSFQNLSPSLVAVIRRATRYEAAKRYRSAKAFGEALEAATLSDVSTAEVATDWSVGLQPKRSEGALLRNEGVRDFLQSISAWEGVFEESPSFIDTDTGVTIDIRPEPTPTQPKSLPTLVPPNLGAIGRNVRVTGLFVLVLFLSIAVGVWWGGSSEPENTEGLSRIRAAQTEVCHSLANTLQSQQQTDGGFSGIPQNPTAMWDTAQQLVALQYSRRCGVDIDVTEQRAQTFLMRWIEEKEFHELVGFGVAWMLMSLSSQEVDAQERVRQVLARFRLPNGSYAVTVQDVQRERTDLYMTTLTAWGLLIHSEEIDDGLHRTLRFLTDQLRSEAVQDISGLEEQIWWTLYLASQKTQEVGPSVDDNQRVAAHMIRRCQLDENRSSCTVPIWPSGTFQYTRANGVTANVLAQGHPWSVIASGALAEAEGLSPEERDAMQVIHRWGQARLTQSPDTLILSPGYVLSESLIAVALGL